MRRQLFEMLDSGGEGFNELVVAASVRIKRPSAPEGAGFSADGRAEIAAASQK